MNHLKETLRDMPPELSTSQSNLNSITSKVKISTTFDNVETDSIYKRMLKAKKKMGLTKEADLIRVAVSFFLDKNGY